MSPYQIELLLHFHCSPTPFPHHDAPAYQPEIEYFLREDLIRLHVELDRPVLTARGRAYVEFLCSMPLPLANWTLPGPLIFSVPKETSP